MEKIALRKLTADLQQEFSLLFCFHSFRQSVDSHISGYIRHGLHDLSVYAIAVIELSQQIHVELDQVNIKSAEYIQR